MGSASEEAVGRAENIALQRKSGKKNLIRLGVGLICLAIIAVLVYSLSSASSSPSIYMKTGEISASNHEEFNVDIMLSDMPEDGEYPAASISVKFDPNKLEFVQTRIGTMETLGGEGRMNIPLWEVNPVVSNRNGKVNAMYLDITGGSRAYTFAGFDKKTKNTIITLSFKLRDSVRPGDKLELEFLDAVLASIDQTKSLASTEKTLRAPTFTISVK